MTKQTKKLSDQQSVTTVNKDQEFTMTDAHGNITHISLANLKAALMGGLDLNALEDGIFVMFHRKSDDFPLMVKPQMGELPNKRRGCRRCCGSRGWPCVGRGTDGKPHNTPLVKCSRQRRRHNNDRPRNRDE